MDNFDELRKQADRIRQTDESTDRDRLVHVENVTFPRSKPVTVDGLSSNSPAIVPAVPPPERLIAEAIRGEYRYGNRGLLLGLASIIGGVVLGLNGVAGDTSWTAHLFGLHSEINDAAPGVVLFVVGIFLVWATRPKVKLRDLKS